MAVYVELTVIRILFFYRTDSSNNTNTSRKMPASGVAEEAALLG